MFEFLRVCFVTLPLSGGGDPTVSIDIERMLAFSSDPAMQEQCVIHTEGGSFTIPWDCQQVSDRAEAECD